MKKLTLLFSLLNLLSFRSFSQTLNYYFGNIHSQTSYSDGNKDSTTSLMTKPLQAFNYAKNSQHIDFYGISDHNHLSAGMSSPSHYHQGIADANTANIDGSFVAMYGFEWGVISGGGHVIVYGTDSLMGWDSGDYDIYVAQSDYTTLWKKVIARPSTFAYLCHPNTTDYGNILTTAVNINADSAIVGMAGRSGPAFSTNTTYSDPSTGNYISQYNDALKYGYHVGIGLDHDTHNSVFGRQTAGRLVVLAPSLTRANIYSAFKKMHFYCSDDWNTKVNFQIQNQPMGSIITHSGTPTLSVTITDPDLAETVSSIVVYYGIPGSGTTCTALTTVTNTANLTYTHAAAANLSKYYYYLEIIQADGDKIWTSPIWYNRNDAVVSNAPVANYTVSTTTICAGQSLLFSDVSTNNPTSWAWNALGASPSSSSLQNPTFTFSTSGTYSVTLVANNAGGSSALYSKTITVKVSPTLTVNSTSICSGTSTNLIATGATSYLWNTGATTSSITITPSVTTSYTVTGTMSGCANTKTVNVIVTTTPTLTANNSTICSGQSASLVASGATTYTWSTGATTSSISVTPTASTNYTITGNTSGCSNTKTISVTVNTTPILTVNGSNICAGTSINLIASGATTYLWNTGATTASISITPSTTTNYTVTGTSTGCTNTKTVSVIVNLLPNVSVSSSTICSGATGTLVASGATTYTWNTGTTGNSLPVSPTTNTNYTVTGTSSAGCIKTATASIYVGTAPSIAVNSTSICSGSSTTLIVSGVSTYTWNTGVHTSSITVAPTSTSIYTVSGNLTGCGATAINTVAVNVITNPTVSVNNNTICAGATATITASGATFYNWNTGATTSVVMVSPLVSTSYSVTGTTNGCSNTKTTNLTVTPLPNVIVNSSSICIGKTATITANGASSYLWNTGAVTNSIYISPTVNTSYTVTGTTSGCSKSIVSNVTVSNNPTLLTVSSSSLLCVGETATLNVSGANTYSWSNGALTSSIAVSPTITSTYSVQGTDANNCSSLVNITQSVSICTGIYESNINSNLGISIYPNPTNGNFTISINQLAENISVEIINNLGQVLYRQSLTDLNTPIDLSIYQEGLYFIRTSLNNNHYSTLKFIKLN